MMNREALIFEVETLAKNLLSYSEALKAGDRQRLHTLLKEGSDLKEWATARDAGQTES